jgi:hypothetical protein
MSREAHVQFCESLGVRFPGATHPEVMNSFDWGKELSSRDQVLPGTYVKPLTKPGFTCKD